jgi:alpha-tubulin suppressor-like RCC1 family protein
MTQETIGYPYELTQWQMISREDLDIQRRNDIANWRLQFDPWCNGEYAVGAIAWGALVMLALSLAL